MLSSKDIRLVGSLLFFILAAIISKLDFQNTNLPQNQAGENRETQTYKVVRVIDGDTIELENGKKVRYIGIDTPETVAPNKPEGCFGQEASNKNRELVEGKEVRLEKDVNETDRYGRLLRYVYVDEVFINEYMVKEGFAFAVSYPPDIGKQDILINAEKEAKEQNRGLWASCN